MAQRKKVLFVINTLGQGGAEVALMQLLRCFDPERYDLSLYVILGQGELVRRLPPRVRLLNRNYDDSDVLSRRGKRRLAGKVLVLALRRGALLRNLPFLWRNRSLLRVEGLRHPELLLWQVLADGCPPMEESYDLAVAYLEGASTYYLSRKVRAERKVAFFHTDYLRSGYSPQLDRGAYEVMDRIYCVSEETRNAFLQAYPDYEGKTEVFYNLIDREGVLRLAEQSCSFDSDGYPGLRIVSLGRLVRMKAVDKSILAMRILRDAGLSVRWYVFGEGSERPHLERLIRENGLEDCFFLPGVVDNPFPYLRSAAVYCQCSDYEGRSLAISEAQLMGCPVVTSNRSGGAGQVTDGADGLLAEPVPETIAAAIRRLLEDPALRRRMGRAAARKMRSQCNMGDFPRLEALLEGDKQR